MKKRIMSMLLVMLLVFSLLPVLDSPALAADRSATPVSQKTSWENEKHPEFADSPLKMTKSLYKNDDGSFDIVIESWANGTVSSETIDTAVPTDFVLVLDQSGSMAANDMATRYEEAGTNWKPSDIQSGTYYYKDPDTNAYYRVVCKDIPVSGYSSLSSPRVADFGTNDTNEAVANYNNNAVYYRDPNDGAIYRLYRQTSTILWRHTSTFYYYDSTGTRQRIESKFWRELGGWSWSITHNEPLDSKYLVTVGNSSHSYGLYYTDGQGVQHQIPGSTSVSNTGSQCYDQVLYVMGEDNTRLGALQYSVESFLNTVKAKAEQDGVDHRVAIVGFSSYSGYNNTELLSGNPLEEGNYISDNGPSASESNGYYYFPHHYNYRGPQLNNGITSQQYANSLQSVNTESGYQNLINAKEAVTAYGGTEAVYGLNMAANILNNRGDSAYYTSGGKTINRNTVVVFFTDGTPGERGTSDQILAANQAVDAARAIKQSQWNTKVFSIGIFDSGDNLPLTFTSTNGDDVEKENFYYAQGGTLYFRGNSMKLSSHNDTIADYMRCVSSDYPDAKNVLRSEYKTSSTGTIKEDRGDASADGVEYYMRVSDQSGLEKAFLSIANTIDTSVAPETVDGNAVLRDVVYSNPVRGDFDAANAEVVAEAVAIKTVDGEIVETDDPVVSHPSVTTGQNEVGNMTLEVTDFDYSARYTDEKTPGEKLVVTIKNLVPRKGGTLYSNASDANIYPTDQAGVAQVVGVESPQVVIPKVTHVIDFNAKMIFANQMKSWKPVGDITNGEYAIASNKDFTYQLLPDQAMPQENKSKIDLVLSGVDTALALNSSIDWTQFTAVPANNVYFDDVLLNGNAIAVGDGSGYNENVTTAVSSGAAELNPNEDKVVYFTFKGTGIDIYCTTTEDSGSVQVSLVSGDEFVNANKVYFEDADGKYVLSDDGKYVLAGADTPADATRYSSSSYAVINKSKTTRYNVPTVTYMNLPYGEYTVYLKAMKPSSDGDGFKLDGVRVYNPLGAPDTYSQEVYQANEADQESNARFYTLRDGLVNDNQDVPVTVDSPKQGVLFVDDASSLSMKNGDGEPLFPDQAAAYKANSPKNEIYLAKDQAIAFTVSDSAKGDHYWIGLSVPDEDANTGSVSINGAPQDLASAVDMYYPINNIDEDGVVVIKNTGDNLVSVTKLKVTSAYDADKFSSENYTSSPNFAEPFGVISKRLFVKVAEFNDSAVEGQQTSSETDQTSQDDLTPSLSQIIRQMISDFVKALFNNIARLFGK